MKNIAIKELRPTQMTHGAREVTKKADDYRKLSGHDLEMAIAEKPVPIVLGPAGRPYVIDHHHIAAAMRLVGVSDVPVVLVEDLSSLVPEEFWFTMENRRWAYPYDVRGQRRPFARCPGTCGNWQTTSAGASRPLRGRQVRTGEPLPRSKTSGGQISSGACFHCPRAMKSSRRF